MAMMTDREKLIELINGALEHASKQCEKLDSCCVCPHGERGGCQSAFILDFLISNSVTFAKDTDVPSKWISADHPPENWKGEGGYLTNFYVYTPEYGVDIGNYMRPANKWLCMGIPCNVTHWMPLPEPPRVQGVPNGTDHV